LEIHRRKSGTRAMLSYSQQIQTRLSIHVRGHYFLPRFSVFFNPYLPLFVDYVLLFAALNKDLSFALHRHS